MRFPFTKVQPTGRELEYVRAVLESGSWEADGRYTRACQEWLADAIGCRAALLAHSCTTALEMAALLSGVGSGDEVLVPSFTFPSSAGAFVLRGATPVFVDVREDTLNLDETLLEDAVTDRTRAIVPVHYAGVSCEMDAILEIARRHDLLVVEDAAQALLSRYRGRPVGGDGALAALSFHSTKNVVSGEGGALLVNDETLVDRARIAMEKGTNRSAFLRGDVDKYSWVDLGSSAMPSELTAAVMLAQLEEAEAITARRRRAWDVYHERLAPLEADGLVRRPVVPTHCEHDAHLYHLLLPSLEDRTAVIARLREEGVGAQFHYVPLHSSPAGRRHGRCHGDLSRTEDLAGRVMRLPLHSGLSAEDAATVAEIVDRVVRERVTRPG